MRLMMLGVLIAATAPIAVTASPRLEKNVHGKVIGIVNAGDTCADHDDPCTPYRIVGIIKKIDRDASGVPSSFILRIGNSDSPEQNFAMDQIVMTRREKAKFAAWMHVGQRVVVIGTQTGAMGMSEVNIARDAQR